MRLCRDEIVKYIEMEADKLSDDAIQNKPFYVYIQYITSNSWFIKSSA